MPLDDRIQKLKERVRKELRSAHDYYWHSKTAWEIVRKSIKEEHGPKIKNVETGTEIAGNELLEKAADYIGVQLPEATFQQFISIFEAFFADFLRLWLSAHPESLSSKQVKVETILEASDKDAIVQAVVDKELNEVTYLSPKEWFEYLDKKVKLVAPTPEEREQFAEAKASRDVLVHNGGVANKTYETKAGKRARFRNGDQIEIPGDYHKATWNLILKMVDGICDAAESKANP